MGELDDGSNFISEETDGDEAFYKWRTIHECEESGGGGDETGTGQGRLTETRGDQRTKRNVTKTLLLPRQIT